jgi:hypothetical protein
MAFGHARWKLNQGINHATASFFFVESCENVKVCLQ